MRRHLLYLLCWAAGWQMQAQEPSIVPPDRPVMEGVEDYMSSAGIQAVIFSGKEETKYPAYIINHPYFKTYEYREGTLSFDGKVYPNVRMRLNQHTDELIVLSPDERFNVVTQTDRVDFAHIGPYYIFYHHPDAASSMPEGYYVRLHDGEYPVFQRERMFLVSSIKDMELESSFTSKLRLYIYKDGKYNSVKSKGSVLKLFKSKKKELKRLIKLHNINFRESAVDATVAVVKLYEDLD